MLFRSVQAQRMALEVGIWRSNDVLATSRLSTQIAQPICETLIPIQSARERRTNYWPLGPPPTSPQSRRRSLNDLIGKRGSRRIARVALSGRKSRQQLNKPLTLIKKPVPQQVLAAVKIHLTWTLVCAWATSFRWPAHRTYCNNSRRTNGSRARAECIRSSSNAATSICSPPQQTRPRHRCLVGRQCRTTAQRAQERRSA